MKRKLGFAGLVAVVVGLIALNLSIRADPEPEPRLDALPARASVGRRRGDAHRTPTEASGEVVTESAPAPGVAEGVVPQQVDGCDHPLIPSRSGQWRLYRWAITTEEHVAEVRIRAERTRALDAGEREVVWMVRATSEDDGERLSQIALRTRCRPGESSEDPWFGILERAIGHRITRRTPRWRWPASLARGASFRGTATLDPSRAEARAPEGVEGEHLLTVTRNHIVGDQVDVAVPAGTFRAWRVAYEERQAYGSHGETGTGTMWVAPDVGLIKIRAQNSRGVVQTIELLRVGGD